jgi:hypothetical protein
MWKNMKVENQTSKNQESKNSWKNQETVFVHIDKISMYTFTWFQIITKYF